MFLYGIDDDDGDPIDKSLASKKKSFLQCSNIQLAKRHREGLQIPKIPESFIVEYSEEEPFVSQIVCHPYPLKRTSKQK